MDLGLKDRVAIVTGGNRGIGYAISAELLKEGANVVVASLDPGRNAQAVEKLKAGAKGKVIGVPTDLTDPAAIENLFKKTLAEFDKNRAFLTKGGVFSDDQIDSFIELKMTEVLRYEMTPHPIEFVQYYSL